MKTGLKLIHYKIDCLPFDTGKIPLWPKYVLTQLLKYHKKTKIFSLLKKTLNFFVKLHYPFFPFQGVKQKQLNILAERAQTRTRHFT